MLKDVFQFSCPCCGKRIEIDTRSGKARAVSATEKDGGTDLDKLLARHKHESDRLGDLFASAKDQQKRQGEQLEAELKRAKEAAKQNPDEKPRSPFDLD